MKGKKKEVFLSLSPWKIFLDSCQLELDKCLDKDAVYVEK